jgi:hypothetical protein
MVFSAPSVPRGYNRDKLAAVGQSVRGVGRWPEMVDSLVDSEWIGVGWWVIELAGGLQYNRCELLFLEAGSCDTGTVREPRGSRTSAVRSSYQATQWWPWLITLVSVREIFSKCSQELFKISVYPIIRSQTVHSPSNTSLCTMMNPAKLTSFEITGTDSFWVNFHESFLGATINEILSDRDSLYPSYSAVLISCH